MTKGYPYNAKQAMRSFYGRKRREEGRVTFVLHAPGQFHVRINGETVQTWDRVEAFRALQSLTDALSLDVLSEQANRKAQEI